MLIKFFDIRKLLLFSILNNGLGRVLCGFIEDVLFNVQSGVLNTILEVANKLNFFSVVMR